MYACMWLGIRVLELTLSWLDIFPARAIAVPNVDGAIAIEELTSQRSITPNPRNRRLSSGRSPVVVIVRLLVVWVNKLE